MSEEFPVFQEVPIINRNVLHEVYTRRIVSVDVKKLVKLSKEYKFAKLYIPPKGGKAILRSQKKPWIEVPENVDDEFFTGLPKLNKSYSKVIQWMAKQEWYRMYSGVGLDEVGKAKFDLEIWYKIGEIVKHGMWDANPENYWTTKLNYIFQELYEARKNSENVRCYSLNPPEYTRKEELPASTGRSFAEYLAKVQNNP